MTRIIHGMPGIYNSSPITLATGDGCALAVNVSGQLIAAAPTGSSANQIQGTIASGATDSTNPVKVGGVYNSTLPTLTNGQRGDLQVDAKAVLLTANAYLQAGEDLSNDVTKVENRYAYSLVTANTAVKSAAGFLHALTFSQNDAAPTAGSIIIYDNTAGSGTQIFNWTLTTAVFIPFTLTLDVSFATGLYVGFTTTNDVNVTVSYR